MKCMIMPEQCTFGLRLIYAIETLTFFAHGAMGGPIELFLVPPSAPRLV